MLLLSFYLLATASAASAEPELSDRIQIIEITGSPEVKVVRGVGHREEIAHKGDNLFVGDEVIVAQRQIVGLEAKDKSRWKVSPGSRFKIEARKPDPQNLAYWSFQLKSGSMWGLVQKAADKKKEGFRLKVRTKMAALGIRGTEYLVGDEEARSTLDVLEGKVWWGKDPAFAPGTYQEVAAGQHAEIGTDGQVTVRPAAGDKDRLVHDYGLVLSDAATKGAPRGTAQQCASLGLGWRSGDGSNGGECSKEVGGQ